MDIGKSVESLVTYSVMESLNRTVESLICNSVIVWVRGSVYGSVWDSVSNSVVVSVNNSVRWI